MKKFLTIISVVALFGCQSDEYKEAAKLDSIDPYGKLSRDDFKKGLYPENDRNAEIVKKRPPLPKASDILLKPQKPKIGVDKTVSISVTEDVPLKDVFLELAKLADIDIEIDNNVSGGVIFKAKNKPFQDVIERLTALAGLKYEINNGILSIKPDLPYVKNYSVNFLNIIRNNSGNINTTANVLSAGEGGDSVTTSSDNAITISSDTDIWASVETNINGLASGERSGNSSSGDSNVHINRQAGTISVYGNESVQQEVQSYLNLVKDFYSTQIMIEAKIVEIQLNDAFRSGVQWNFLELDSAAINFGGTEGFAGTPFVAPGNVSSVIFDRSGGDIAGMVELTQIFGATRTLSSPRVMVLNNQQAVLNFLRNETYYEIDIEPGETTVVDGVAVTEPPTFDSTVVNIPIGIILNIHPIVEKATQEIVMNVRPTVSRLTGESTINPSVLLELDGLSNADAEIARNSSARPQVEVREMDSVLRMQNGQIMAIGGMIEQRNVAIDSGTPWLQEIPILGNAFKTVDKQTEAIQTVIFLKATIVPGYGVEGTDQNFYNSFTNDPRPLKF